MTAWKRLILRLKTPHQIRGWDLLLVLIPALGWGTALQSRPSILEAPCRDQPVLCSRDDVPWPDRKIIDFFSDTANTLSFVTQDAAGGFAVLIPGVLHASGALAGRLSPAAALAAFGTDFVLLLEAALWNGFLTESTRILVQRPRPFVYRDVGREGANPAHYTSFYSGHTSFSAAASLALFLILLARGAPRRLLTAGAGLGFALTAMTALFRVLAGRHFITDVGVGALAGMAVALLVFSLHPRRGKSQ